jgi:3-hydroxyisobutyrate dehydrogenase-like beta-hydroxyacid dehydrogenase
MSHSSVSAESSSPPEHVAVIGLGDMGTALAQAFLTRGHPVTVWNRTPAKAAALAANGARHATSVRDAVEAASLVVACVLDYPVLKSLLKPVASALSGRALVNLATGSPREAREMSDWISQHRADYLDGGIMATPSMIGQPHALILYSGSSAAFEAHGQTLSALGPAKFLGVDAGFASLHDMALLSGMYGMFSGFFHALALAGSEGVKAATLMELLGPWLQATLTFLPTYVEQIDSRDYGRHVEANLGMQVVALENIVRASREQGLRSDLLTPLLTLFKNRATDGHGAEDISGIVELIRKSPSGSPASH